MRKYLLFVFLEILGVDFELFAYAQCPSGWIQHESICYFFSHDKATWSDAGETCKLFSTKLAEPKTMSAVHFITGNAQLLKDVFWIGITDMIIENEWIYPTDMTPILISNWAAGEPNGRESVNCVATWYSFSSLWADEPCSYKYKFVCQKLINGQEIIG